MTTLYDRYDDERVPAEIINTLPESPAYVAISLQTASLRWSAICFEMLLNDVLEIAVAKLRN